MSCVHVYTGDGKGKTTAALGLLLRACGANHLVRVFQFLKQGDYSEIKIIRSRFPEVSVTQLGSGAFIGPGGPSQADKQRARDGLALAEQAIQSGEYDLVILDEINGCLQMGLLSLDEVLRVIAARPERTELVLTGRGAPQGLIDAADLCTEMRMVKHYYTQGIPAREGIEL